MAPKAFNADEDKFMKSVGIDASLMGNSSNGRRTSTCMQDSSFNQHFREIEALTNVTDDEPGISDDEDSSDEEEDDDSEEEEEDSDDEEESGSSEEESDSDSDDDSDSDFSTSESDDDALAAAEELLKGMKVRREGLMSMNSMRSIAGGFGKETTDEVRNKMDARSRRRTSGRRAASRNSISHLGQLTGNKESALPTNKPPETDTNRRQSFNGGLLARKNVAIGYQTRSAKEIEVDDGAANPDDHLAELLGMPDGDSLQAQRYTYDCDTLEGYFLAPKPEYVDAWTMELTTAVREHDLEAMKRMLYQDGHLMQACNNFGESIVHLAVRRGSPEILRFLLQDAGVSMRVCDEFGRTPIHDAAWCLNASNPDTYQKMALLLNESPMQLMITDARGFTPLAYVPRSKWKECNAFLDRQLRKGRLKDLSVNTQGIRRSAPLDATRATDDSNDGDDSPS